MVAKKAYWQILGASVRGSFHYQHHLPNQDAMKWDFESSNSSILAISDGHGSDKCFRSDKGARIAVHVAINTIKRFLASDQNILNQQIVSQELPQEIALHWKKLVRDDIQQHPFSETELNLLKGKSNTLAYGTTLLTVLATQHFIIYWQIGDGDILIIDHQAMVTRAIPKDEHLIANQTTSLCANAAWEDFRCYVQQEHLPKFILLASDGYGNSFSDDENFFKVGSDIGKLIDSEGSSFVKENLESWLVETSQNGSGDDITMGFIFQE
ncbi:MAG: protein phosphatase 2C domain-containing protein [Thiomargarita sp.]|nr:protein phosphatase 2C domain-containing protein [Thiomargarita sp.]